MLLQEYRPFQVDKELVEASIRKNKPLIVSGVLQRANAKNQNERVYPKDILAREMRSYMEGPVREKRALGELDHPESSVINLQNVSHNVVKCWWDGDDVMGDVEILPTPAGNILKALLESNIKLGVSSRGMGSLQENSDGLLEVQDDFDLLCWDFVSTPSNPGSYMTTLNEGKINSSYNPYQKAQNTITEILCSNGNCPIF